MTVVKNRVEAEADTLQELIRDLDGVKELLQPTGLDIQVELYERIPENGRPHWFKARLVLTKEQEQTDG